MGWGVDTGRNGVGSRYGPMGQEAGWAVGQGGYGLEGRDADSRCGLGRIELKREVGLAWVAEGGVVGVGTG